MTSELKNELTIFIMCCISQPKTSISVNLKQNGELRTFRIVTQTMKEKKKVLEKFVHIQLSPFSLSFCLTHRLSQVTIS